MESSLHGIKNFGTILHFLWCSNNQGLTFFKFIYEQKMFLENNKIFVIYQIIINIVEKKHKLMTALKKRNSRQLSIIRDLIALKQKYFTFYYYNFSQYPYQD